MKTTNKRSKYQAPEKRETLIKKNKLEQVNKKKYKKQRNYRKIIINSSEKLLKQR